MDFREEVSKFVIDNFMFGAKNVELGWKDSLHELGIIDSTGVLEIVQFLESKFGIAVDDEDIIPENLDSVHNIVQFISRKSVPSAGKN